MPDFSSVVRQALADQARHRRLDADGLRAARETGTLPAFFGDQAPLALVQFDTPGLQEYVFRVSRPIDIRGGSSIVRDFTPPPNTSNGAGSSIYASLSPGVTRNNFIYAGAGNGLLVVPAHKADEVRDAIEQALSDITKGELRSIAVALPVWPDDLDPAAGNPPPPGLAAALGRPVPMGRYALARGVLQVRLARRRSESTRLRPSLVSSDDHARRCDACKINVGRPRQRPTPDEAHLCAACEARRDFAGRERRQAQEPRTFEDVVKGTGSRAMAVLYADGANFGRLFREAANPGDHHARSVMVDGAFEVARTRVEAFVRAVAGADDGDDDLRVQTSIAGGDDLVLVVPGTLALNCAQILLKTLESAFDSQLAALGIPPGEQPPGVGLGVVVADHHFPLPLLLHYAKELMGLAKTKRLRGPNPARSAVDFMVLTSGSPLGGAIEGSRDARHTRRPYRRQEFDDFLVYVRALAEVAHEASAQVHAVRQEVLRGVEASRSLWRYQHARSDDERDDARGWGRFRATLGCRLADVDRLLWESAADGSPTTRYLDAVEALACLDAWGPR